MDTLERPAARDAPLPQARPGRWVAALVIVVAAVGIPLGVLGAQKKTVVLMGDSLSAISAPVIVPYFSLLGYALQPAALSGSGLLDTQVNWVAHGQQLIAQYDPSTVVVEFIGDYGFLGERPGVGAHTPAFYEQWGQVAQQLEDVLTARGAKVYWVIGPPVSNPVNDAAIVTLDHIYEHLHAPDTASGHPLLINVTPALTGGTGRYTEDLPGPGGVPVEVRTPDGTHFTLYGAALYGRAIAQAIGAAPRS
jgi:hypothetical protein